MKRSRLLCRLKFAIDYSDIVQDNKIFTSYREKTQPNDREENIVSVS